MTNKNAEFEQVCGQASMLDQNDDLNCKQLFHIPAQANGDDAIYFGTTCLGLQPKSTKTKILEVLEGWGSLGVNAWWNSESIPWLEMHDEISRRMTGIIGANVNEISIMSSLTSSLHAMLFYFFLPSASRNNILTEAGQFSTVKHAIQSHLDIRADSGTTGDLLLFGQEFGNLELSHLEESLNETVSVVVLAGVNYITGQKLNFPEIVEMVHSKGAIIGFDLAHAVGNVELRLHDWNVDFAVWCSYKYLCAGPGAVGGCFVHERHLGLDNHKKNSYPQGWWGQSDENKFMMLPSHKPAESAKRFQVSTPPIIQYASLDASLEVFENIGMERLARRSRELSEYCLKLFDAIEEVCVITPREFEERGQMITISLSSGDELDLMEYLKSNGVVCDIRSAKFIRFALSPLYCSFADVARLASLINIFLKRAQ